MIAARVCKVEEAMIRINIMPRDHVSLLNLKVVNEPGNELNANGADAASSPHSLSLF